MLKNPEQRTHRVEARQANILLFGLYFGCRGALYFNEPPPVLFSWFFSLFPEQILDFRGLEHSDHPLFVFCFFSIWLRFTYLTLAMYKRS